MTIAHWPWLIDRQHYTGLSDPPRTPGAFLRGNAAAVRIGCDLKGHPLHPPAPRPGRGHSGPFSSTYPVHPDEWPSDATLYGLVLYHPNTELVRYTRTDTTETVAEWMVGARQIAAHLEGIGYRTGLYERLKPLGTECVFRAVIGYRTDGVWRDGCWYLEGQ